MISRNIYSMDRLRDIYMMIHKAIHDGSRGVTIDDMTLPIEIAPNKCRRIVWNGMTFMEQNKDQSKKTSYADRARAGEKLTWIIAGSHWSLITDKGIQL